MISITLDENNLSLAVSGHADYAPKGYDIVCSAVSSLVYVLCTCEGKEIDDGERWIISINESELNRAVFTAVADGLYAVAQTYPNNVEIKPLVQ